MDNVLLMQQGAFFKMGLNVLLNVVLSISLSMDRLPTFDKVLKLSYDLLTTRLGLSMRFIYSIELVGVPYG